MPFDKKTDCGLSVHKSEIEKSGKGSRDEPFTPETITELLIDSSANHMQWTHLDTFDT